MNIFHFLPCYAERLLTVLLERRETGKKKIKKG